MATVSDLIDRVSTHLDDIDHANWSITELRDYLNDGLKAIVHKVPTAYTKTAVVTLVSGTKQTLPSDGLHFIAVKRAYSGTTPGNACRVFDRGTLDATHPDWHSDTPGPVRQYAPDVDPRVFWVYPPQPDPPEEAEIQYSVEPPAILEDKDTIPVDASWEPALVDYMLYRALSKDAEYAGDASMAAAHYTAFLEAVGGNGK